MAPNPRVIAAFRAMKSLGIDEVKVKPVLKKLLKLYDKNWELIEEENYRVLADAIFDEDDTIEEEKKKGSDINQEDDMEEETLVNEPLRPFKRLRRGSEVNQPGNVTESPESRAEGSSISPRHTVIKDKGKQPMVSDSGFHHKPNVPTAYQLIKPKDEPYTDDMFARGLPQYEPPPIAVLRPEPLIIKGISAQNDGSGGEIGKQSCTEDLNAEGRTDGVASSPGEVVTDNELATVQSSSNLDVATSSLGEVKLSLSWNLASGRSNSRLPNIDDVIKLTEAKCLRAYKVIDPNFSVMKLLTHVCESFLELGTDDTDESQDGTINISTLDALKRSPALNAFGAGRENVCIPSNGIVNGECHISVDASQIPIALPLSSLDSHAGKDKDRDLEDHGTVNSKSLVAASQCELDPDDLRSLHDINDISKGEERVKIPWLNEINSECPTSFHYISQSLVFQNAEINISLSGIGDLSCCPTCFGDCLSAVVPCTCAHETGSQFAYAPAGVVKNVFLEECINITRDPQRLCTYFCGDCPLERSKNDVCLEPCKGHLKRNFIKECWSKCGCNKQCGNRVVQRGITCNLRVFFTPEGKGWGLQTLEDLPKGTFICEYVGEILTCTELYKRNMHGKSRKDTYLALLDAGWDANGALKNEKALCLDASQYGNAARFINHRCFDANLIEIPVEVETPDRRYYHLAFFTARNVHAMEELSWDYGIDFDDLDHPIKPFECRCGSKFCRNMKRPNRSKSMSNAR
ncbi:probable inactive histone-lysine N-methyltransferase SUVR2 isoform X2 [Humulus lupulus]|uniref:probable inactive histone-lysine N-methyltransferase SUVR2 isoform X2 n=1 Tax=Humulus lupulus TaxID=3486 RepID=UPI002B414EDC|nr:probable inactive histone-lysine N-methyltransferase SUVR2 isoform X2 [Humulus lupulus]